MYLPVARPGRGDDEGRSFDGAPAVADAGSTGVLYRGGIQDDDGHGAGAPALGRAREHDEEATMIGETEENTLSISYLNALEYCPRRFYYECALSEFIDNAHTAEGTMLHERSDSGLRTLEDGITTFRRVWVWSDRLKLSGFADVVEEQEGRLVPIEYKKGKMGEWLNDHVQICAQAFCLEEMRGCTIPCGYIFYFGSARREEVTFDEALRQHTKETIQQAFDLLERGVLPPP